MISGFQTQERIHLYDPHHGYIATDHSFKLTIESSNQINRKLNLPILKSKFKDRWESQMQRHWMQFEHFHYHQPLDF